MKLEAIFKARSRLRIAERALADIEQCKDYDTFTQHWYVFLTATKNIYTVLSKGAKDSAQSRQWVGKKVQQRKDDPLLQYLYQARSDDEHGIEPVSRLAPGGIGLGRNKPGYSNAIEFSLTYDAGLVSIEDMKSLDGKPVLLEAIGPHAQLIRVHGRDGRPYDPPKTHKGQSLTDFSPANIARLAIAYMSELIAEAEKLA